MIPRGSGRRVALVVVVAGVIVVAATLLAYRRPPVAAGPANPATSTLTLALPGPFNGCSVVSPGTNASSSSILDLIRPSAFLVGPTNVLSGEGGAIVSAELISLHPERVVYSVDPRLRWSNGHPFSVNDLITWWRSARSLQSVNGDGYRHIATMLVNRRRTSVTATFSSDFADWNLLFHDVEQSGTTRSCAVNQLLSQPSLGPYLVQSATPSRVELLSNRQWTSNYNRFHRIVITSSDVLAQGSTKYFVGYAPVATKALVDDLVAHPHYLGQFAQSSDIEELTFSPHSALTARLDLRVALSWSLNRRQILDQLFGSFTAAPSVPTSALFSLGQVDYPTDTPTLTPTPFNAPLADPAADCRACAQAILLRAGYLLTSTGWRTHGGAPLFVRVGEGPSPLDHATARLVDQQWTALGIHVTLIGAPSDELAATMSAVGRVDVAVFDRPTSTTPWTVARSWDQTPFVDAYPSGVYSASNHQLFTLAQATFNPSTAALIWRKLDERILSDFWVRPLYTAPSMIEYSGSVANVIPSLSLAGLVDQATNWGITLPSSATSVPSVSSAVG